MMFDSGSSELWIPHQNCGTLQCKKHRRIDIPRDIWDSSVNIEYLSGRLEGFKKALPVFLDEGVSAKSQMVDFATSINIPLLDAVKWDGIVGFGLRAAGGSRPIIETLKDEDFFKERKMQPIISYYISKNMGKILFGSIDYGLKKNPKEDFQWTSVPSDADYWSIEVQNIEIEYPKHISKPNSVFEAPKNPAILDTGTYLIYFPPDLYFRHFHDFVGKWESQADHHKLCSDRSKLPTLNFIVKKRPEGTFKLSLKPHQYVQEFTPEGKKNTCLLGVVPDNQSLTPTITLGQILFKAYYTIFDSR
eukprot:GHVP01053188.1.p1 GENE.GHVP01053188.1~~GHVP01053188.1.p1  ORF type:complete len:304 (-),score=54.01 GHVP01053188.1:776-1687(-)